MKLLIDLNFIFLQNLQQTLQQQQQQIQQQLQQFMLLSQTGVASQLPPQAQLFLQNQVNKNTIQTVHLFKLLISCH